MGAPDDIQDIHPLLQYEVVEVVVLTYRISLDSL